jgi:hypothetical protein
LKGQLDSDEPGLLLIEEAHKLAKFTAGSHQLESEVAAEP